MRAFARSLLACLAVGVAAWVWLDLRVWHGPLHAWLTQDRQAPAVAEVEGSIITRHELAQALREHLWKSSASWQSMDAATQSRVRHEVLETLINARLIRVWRVRENPAPPATLDAHVRAESDMLRRQFTTAEEAQSRLAGQGHSSKSFEAIIREQQLDEAWLVVKAEALQPTISDGEIQAWHARFKERLRIPAAHHVAHLFLAHGGNGRKAREPEIGRLYQQLQNPQSFATLVQKHSEDARTKAAGGDLGWVTRQRMPADFMAAVEKADIGRVSPPVVTALGWHVIRVLERHASRLPALAEVRGEIAAFLHNQRRQEAVAKVLAELRRQSEPRIMVHAKSLDMAVPAP